MSETSSCPQCGAELPQPDTGPCPACLLKLGLSGAIPAPPLSPDVALAPPARRRWPAFAGTAALLIAIALALAWPRRPALPAPPVKLFLPPPAESAWGSLAVSPDGLLIVFSASARDGKSQLWIRPLASLDPRPLAGTDAAEFPFWSPDSRSVGFFAGGKLKKIGVADGAVQVLCEAPEGRGGAWSPQGQILFAPSDRSGLFLVPATGGVSLRLTTLDSYRAETSHRWPVFLPDGRHFLFTAIAALREDGGLTVASLDQPRKQKRLLPDLSNAAFADHYLLFGRAGSLLAQPFDAVRLELSGSPRPVAESVGFDGREAYVPASASNGGILVFDSGSAGAPNQLAWFDRSGKILGAVGEAGFHSQPELAPDDRLAAETREDPQRGSADVWLDDFVRGVASRFTFDQNSRNPVWSPDGTRIAYASSDRDSWALMQKPANGASAQELLFRSSKPKLPTAWSRDGRFLLYQALDSNTGWDLWVLPLNGEHKPALFLQTPFSEQHATFSPDGNWIAYDSDESGRSEVYVQAWVGSEKTREKWQISAAGGSYPKWRTEGRGIFYLSPDHMVVEVPIQGTLQPGVPQPAFSARGADPRAGFALSPDGKRFLIPISESEQAPAPATVVLNWTATLRP